MCVYSSSLPARLLQPSHEDCSLMKTTPPIPSTCSFALGIINAPSLLVWGKEGIKQVASDLFLSLKIFLDKTKDLV